MGSDPAGSVPGLILAPTRRIRQVVPADAAPQRLDLYLTALLPRSSRSQIQKLISRGNVRVDRRIAKASHRVSAGQELSVEIPPAAPSPLKPEPIPLKILHEDSHLIVVDKPAGLVVHPAPGHPGGTLVNALLAHGSRLSSVAGPFKPGIVHRLDKDTSGILLVAKEDEAHRHLARQFADRTIRRTYLALVQGLVQQDEGTIEAPIGRHPVNRQRMTVRYGGGREALTRYRVLRRFRKGTLLELHPQTGRTHQLRVHLAHLGHPILGDLRYGVGGGFPRQALHAHRLGFRHPADLRWVEFSSPFPEDLEGLLKDL
ncbi:MAG: RluA family pseudouridine synthase [Candidatus Omnitrophica bacterium]|nr:RluA family pseudouridine synthase [Candidatus Omnitrophota bacterium]